MATRGAARLARAAAAAAAARRPLAPLPRGRSAALPGSGSAARRWHTAVAAAGEDTNLKFELGLENVALGRGQGPLPLYEALVEGGQLQRDAEQQRVLEYLNAVYYGAPKRSAKGLYLYGSVGCGKTMSMDLFYTAVRGTPGLRVVRRHFHDFLHDLQLQLHKLKLEGAAGADGPVATIGARIASETDVLCFDEFAITTIQDCVLLMPLFSALFNHGVTVVATSNRAPEDLYTDGLNRHLYLPPFLKTLRQHCRVFQLQGSKDYRRVHHENSPDAGVFCWPPRPGFVDGWFEQTTGGGGGARARVPVSFGRSLEVPQLSSCGRIARFSFEDLCKQHLSADDYLAICRQLHTILLDDVPRLSVDQHNEARRFTTLIDSCYEHHVRLICSMEGPPEELLGNLSQLQDLSVSGLGKGGGVGCGDGDTSPSSSGVLQAIDRIKDSMARRRGEAGPAAAGPPGDGPNASEVLQHPTALDVLGAEVDRVQGHGEADVDIWRQDGGSSTGGVSLAPPQVSKAWDDRRRISQFTWESEDPTSEQQTIKGVFTAAVASLKESGFAVERAISRLREMQTEAFQQHHQVKHLGA